MKEKEGERLDKKDAVAWMTRRSVESLSVALNVFDRCEKRST